MEIWWWIMIVGIYYFKVMMITPWLRVSRVSVTWINLRMKAMNLGISEQPGIPNHLRPSLGYWTSIAVRINYFHSMRGYHECRPGLTFMMTFMGLKNRCTTIDPNWWQSTGGILMETSPAKTAMCRQLPARIWGDSENRVYPLVI